MIDIEEWTVPVPKRLRGRITVEPGPIFATAFDLHDNGRHHWRPIAPCARVDVEFEHPDLAWRGDAYLDMNNGDEPLETGFRRWDWCRSDEGGATTIHYDTTPREGASRNLALEYRADGSASAFEAATRHALSRTGWRVAREARASRHAPARVDRTLEDTPFYSRSLLAFDQGRGSAVHETVDLDRFRARWVQMLLPFKMPRVAGRGASAATRLLNPIRRPAGFRPPLQPGE